MLAVLNHALWRRRTGLLGWAVGLVGLTALIAVAYPTVRDNSELDKTFAHLSPGVQAALGLSGGAGLTSPVGYLNSQFFANLLPVVLLVSAVGAAAWAVAGDEAAGTLELLLANPVSRTSTALARAGAVTVQLVVLVTVTTATLAALAPGFGLTRGLAVGRMVAAGAACGALAFAFAALAFAVGAATGSRTAALSVTSAVAVAGYVVEGIAEQVRILRPVRAASPWHWLIGTDPLAHGLAWQAWVLPLGVGVVLVAAGTFGFARRDLR